MNIDLVESGNTRTPGNFFIAALYDPSAPTIVAYSYVLPGPYTSPVPIPFHGIPEQMWNFLLWENTIPTVGGISSNPFSFTPTNATANIRPDLYLTADVSVNLVSGTNSYIADTPNNLTGWQYDLERRPQGTIQPGNDWAMDANGWHLLAVGDLIAPGEQFILHFLPQTAVTLPPPVTTGIIVVPQTITGSITLDNTFTGKLGLIQGAASSLVITLPTISSMAANKVIGFASRGGNHISAILQCAGSDTISFSNGAGGSKTRIVLCQNEQIQLFKNGTVWEILSISDTVRMSGEIIYDYNYPGKLNSVLANGNKLNRLTYARLWDYVQSLPSAMLVADGSWGNSATLDNISILPNIGKYTTGDGSTTFGIPRLYTYGFLRAVDGASRFAGDLQGDALLNHKQDSLIGSLPGSPNGVGPSKFGGGYKGTFTQPTDLSSTPTTTAGVPFVGRIAAENRPFNNGVFCLIRL